MRRALNKKRDITKGMVLFPYGEMGKFNELMEQYGDMPTRQIYREIARVKGEVSQEVVDQHLKNLDTLTTMEGFMTEDHKEKVERVKVLLGMPGPQSKGAQSENIETEFVSGTSLLLWFLILVAIW
ncbi:MAG: hypothetical protein ACOYVK_18795 [Bacillota bacterium]